MIKVPRWKEAYLRLKVFHNNRKLDFFKEIEKTMSNDRYVTKTKTTDFTGKNLEVHFFSTYLLRSNF